MPDNRNSYLVKLLTLLIKRSNGRISIPAADLMSEDNGEGLQVHFDYETRELVLTFVPKGSTTYRIEGNQTWLSQPTPVPLPSPPRPMTSDELLARAWTDAAGTPTNQETRKGKVVTLTDESMATAEAKRQAAEVMRRLQEWQPGVEEPQYSPRTSRYSK